MPILLNVSQLEPGMCLTRNVTNQFSVLLSRGHHLSELEIASLQERFPEMLVEIGDLVLDQAVEFQYNQKNAQVSQTVRNRVYEMARKAGQTVRSGADLQVEHVVRAHVV